MSSDAGASPVNLTPSGPPEATLALEPADAREALEAALGRSEGERRAAVADGVARWPRFLAGWATLGDLARDDVAAYACYRVGDHRGLDRLRQSGWRGPGCVRWRHELNRGFLRALQGLPRKAATIGEVDEAERCALFLAQLDPTLHSG